MKNIFNKVSESIISRVSRRPPDFIVGGAEDPYLLRWFIIPRNRFFNIYLHQFLRDDDDRALHDHPWFWCSILLRDGYIEHTIKAGGVHQRRIRWAPSIKLSSPWSAHRIEVGVIEAWTIFITGPRMREWGFHCPNGWVHWRDFTNPDDTGTVGRGCGEGVRNGE